MGCLGCNFNQYPPCAVQTIYSSTSVEDMMDHNKIKQIAHLVCHKNAQIIKENKMAKAPACDECQLCDFLCIMRHRKDEIEAATEKVALSNLNRLNILFQSAIPDALVISEAKAKGNAREKRIDMVIKKGDWIYFIKVLNDVDKLPYYSRSYSDLIDYYSTVMKGVISKRE